MLFNSFPFIFIFLPITFFIYFYLFKKRLIWGAKLFLVFASLFFYGYWNLIYIPLILFSIIFNYLFGYGIIKNIHNFKTKRYILIGGILFNVLLLGYFKYMDFFIINLNSILNMNLNLLHIVLPLGISFFTFTQIAYLVDAYKAEAKEYSLLNYALFVTYFPHLLAGPILHHKEMMPQFENIHNYVKNYKNIAIGIFVFSIGLFKKVVIADTFASWADIGFDVAGELNLVEAWAVSLSYTFQLYFDFSGYTDMAIGISYMFNIVLPINFNSPYKSLDIQDFWRRWHITLSRFLRNYLYIPLGGNRDGNLKTYHNLMLTFLIGGLWHGAGWTFILWGGLHGAGLVVHRIWRSTGVAINKYIAWFITFNFINLTWVFFRANSLSDAIKIITSMFDIDNIVIPNIFKYKLPLSDIINISYGNVFFNIGANTKEITLFMLIGFMLTLFFNNTNQIITKFRPTYLKIVFIMLMFITSVYYMSSGQSEFLYFNF